MAQAAESGKDAIMIGAGLKLPLFQGAYSDGVAAARASARAARADRRARIDRGWAELSATLSQLRNGRRRIVLFRDT